jgi:Carboxypeptidase regulatory-like domain
VRAWFLMWAVVISSILPTAQEKTTVGDFTKSPTEHIINQIEQPFVVRSIKGIVSRKTEGPTEPLAKVLFEIQGPGTDRKIRRTSTDEKGRFKMGNVPEGTYRFKATLNGFQSVMGTITVSKEALKTDELKIAMPIGV